MFIKLKREYSNEKNIKDSNWFIKKIKGGLSIVDYTLGIILMAIGLAVFYNYVSGFVSNGEIRESISADVTSITQIVNDYKSKTNQGNDFSGLSPSSAAAYAGSTKITLDTYNGIKMLKGISGCYFNLAPTKAAFDGSGTGLSATAGYNGRYKVLVDCTEKAQNKGWGDKHLQFLQSQIVSQFIEKSAKIAVLLPSYSNAVAAMATDGTTSVVSIASGTTVANFSNSSTLRVIPDGTLDGSTSTAYSFDPSYSGKFSVLVDQMVTE